MATLHITRGLPGSGKTTYAKKWVSRRPLRRIRINRDEMRMCFFGSYEGLSDAQERAVHQSERAVAEALLRLGWDVIIDDTNLRSHFVLEWNPVARKVGAKFRVHSFYESLEVCIERDRLRGEAGERIVGPETIRALARSSGYPEKGP